MLRDPRSRTLGRICNNSRQASVDKPTQVVELAAMLISENFTSPTRALIFKGTKSSARVTPMFTMAVAAPAS